MFFLLERENAILEGTEVVLLLVGTMGSLEINVAVLNMYYEIY